VIIFLPIPQLHVRAPEILQPGAIVADSSRTTGASSNVAPGETQQQHSHLLVHGDAAIVASDTIMLDAHLKILRETGSSNNKKQHEIGCEAIRINVHDGQLTFQRTAGVHRELRDRLSAAHNGNLPWSTKALVRAVCAMERHDVVTCGIFADEPGDQRRKKWTIQASKTSGQATESFMVEVTSDYHSRSSNYFLVGFRHVSYNGKTWRSGTA